MAHIGDKHSHEQLKRMRIEQDKAERDKIWTLYPAYIKAQYLSEEAKKRNAWLYDPNTRRWYTPEEFLAETRAFPANAEIFKKIQIRHPIDCVNAGNKQIAALLEKLKAFTQRVVDYYSNK